MNLDDVRALIRDVPDFPKPGIVFKDITPVLQHGLAFRTLIDAFADRYADTQIDQIVGIESRGFLLASALAYRMGVGLALVRKPKKLPFQSVRVEYALEYGTDALEMHVDAVRPHQNVLIVDDVLATGGTAAAAGKLVRELGGRVVGYGFFIELGFLGGRTKLPDEAIFSAVVY